MRSTPIARTQVQIFITETCNLRCEGCPYPLQTPAKKAALLKQEISPQKWAEINDYLYQQGNRLFFIIGGEPASYPGVEQVIHHLTDYPDVFVALSTSGIHLLRNEKLRLAVGEALARPANRQFKNALAISFDALPTSAKTKNSRQLKAELGLAAVRLMKEKFGDQITYTANLMVTPQSLSSVLEIQTFLENEGVYLNLCTQQGKCFGQKNAVFSHKDFPALKDVAVELIRRKLNHRLVLNSVSYLSQLPGMVGLENYHCWEESSGSPVIDLASNGKIRYCNWIGQDSPAGPPGIEYQDFIQNHLTWTEFSQQSKKSTQQLCTGCSWSRRDRSIEPMVEFNSKILIDSNLPPFNPQEPAMQNLWAQAQMAEEK